MTIFYLYSKISILGRLASLTSMYKCLKEDSMQQCFHPLNKAIILLFVTTETTCKQLLNPESQYLNLSNQISVSVNAKVGD